MATIVNSTPAVADVINKSSLLADATEETAEAAEETAEAAEETSTEEVVEQAISLEAKDGIVEGTQVRYIGDIQLLLNKIRITIAMSADPTNRDGTLVSGGGATKEQRDFARAAAAWYVRETGAAILSGGMRGIDQLAINAAISAESENYGKGMVGVVVPMGIDTFMKSLKGKNDKETEETQERFKKAIIDKQLVIISTNLIDDAAWTKADSKPRNKLLAKMSDAILVPHIASSYNPGDTFSGGVMNLLEYAESFDVPVGIRPWKRGEHPIFTTLPHLFPNNIVMLKRGHGIASVADLLG